MPTSGRGSEARLSRIDADPAARRPTAVRRKTARYSQSIEALLGSVQGERARVLLTDVSTHGCAVETDVDWLRVGGFVSISLSAREAPLQAIIRWVRGRAAGMEFLRPVPPERESWHALMSTFPG